MGTWTPVPPREWMLVVRNSGPLPPVFRSPLEPLAHRVRGVQASARDSLRCVGGARLVR